MTAQNDERSEPASRARDSAPAQELLQRVGKELPALEAEDLSALSLETARRRLQEVRGTVQKLEAACARYSDLYDLAPVGYLTVSEQGLILEANLTAATLLDEARSALVQQPLPRFILKQDQDNYHRHCKKLFAIGEPQTCELRMVKKDGTPFWAHLAAAVAHDAGGAPICRVVLSDITERKRADQALLASEAKYRRLHETMMDAFVSVSMDGRIQECNQAYQEMLGYREEALRNLSYLDLTPKKWHAMEARIVADEILPNGYSRIYEKEYQRKDGTVFPIELRTFLIRDDAGQATAMWAIVRDITERKRAAEEIRQLNATLEERVRERTAQWAAANEELRRSQARQKQIAEVGRVGFWDWDLHSNSVSFSPEWKRQLGCEDHEIGNDHAEWERRLHPDDRGLTLEEMRRCLADPGHGYQLEFRLQHKDGSYRWLLAQGAVLCDESGRPLSMVGSQFDLTERRRSEAQLRKLTRALEQSPSSIVITDLLGNIEYVNAKFTATTGYGLDEVRGRNSRLLKSGEMPPEEYARLWQTITRGGEWRGEFHNKKKNGELFWEMTVISPIYDEAGHVTHFLAVKEDITERKLAEARLLDSELRFRTLFESAPVAMALHRSDGRYLKVNQAYVDMLGYPREDLLRLGPRRVTHPDDVAEGQRLHRELCAGPRDHYWREKRFLRQDGRVVWARSSNALVRGLAGNLDYSISVVEDVTAKKRAAECNTAFARLAVELSASTTLIEAAHVILRTAAALFNWDAACLLFDSPDGEEVLPVLQMDTIDGCRVEVSPAMERMRRTPRMEAILRSGAKLINQDAADVAVPDWSQSVPFGDPSRPSASIMCVPIRHSGRGVGLLSILSYTPHTYRPEDVGVLQVLADHCGGALDRVQAAARVKWLEAEIVEIATCEQRRIGFELHDGLGQTLGGIALKAKLLEQQLRERHQVGASAAAALVGLLNQAMSDTRRLARGLAPTELELTGLPVTIERLLEEIAASSSSAWRFTCDPPDLQLHPFVTLHLYRITQEALHNAIKHAHPLQIEVSLTVENQKLCLVVRDDGVGMNLGAQTQAGMGLRIMRYRAGAIGAEFTLRSAPGQGTEVRCVLPDLNVWQTEQKVVSR